MLTRLYHRLLTFLSLPAILGEFFDGSTGRAYGLTLSRKVLLVWTFLRNTKRVTTASHFLEHLVMATRLLRVPPEVKGCVVECGCYQGGSTTNLSILCEITGRPLHVFDSFKGLPAPSEADRSHALPGPEEEHVYEEGGWAASLETVKRNIAAHGKLEVCTFHEGFFDATLPGFGEPCVLAFVDVDLVSSLQTCLKNLWLTLVEGSCLFTHEAHHHEIALAFFDRAWWRENLKCEPPGLVGAGCGLGLQPKAGGYGSAIGYAVKNLRSTRLERKDERGLEQ
ncbi:MAG: hypothetical protein GC164_02340 [Phycisphaera sp.]|nr:hypothetical protein [Phycisphaera sp.]